MPRRPRKYPLSPYNANIFGSFSNPTIDLTLNSIHLNLNQNTASVDSNLGDGLIRILPLTFSAAVYNTLPTTPFVVPANPGLHATGTGTAVQIAAAVWVHTENTWILREQQATDKALKQLLFSSVGDMYTINKKHWVTGYANVTTRKLIIHLYSKYGNITAGVINENKQIIKTAYDTIQLIETLYT